MILENLPCHRDACSSFHVEVFSSGLVRWVGFDFVSAVGERHAAIDPSAAQALIEQWRALSMEGVPATFFDALPHPHAAVRCVSGTRDGAVTRHCAAVEISSFDPDDPAAPLDIFATKLDEALGVERWRQRRCYESIQSIPSRTSLEDAYPEHVVRRYESAPENAMVRIVVGRRQIANEGALALRKALLAEGVPLSRVRYEQAVLPQGLPLETQPWGYLMRSSPRARTWGWVAVTTPSCIEEADVSPLPPTSTEDSTQP